VPLGFWFKNGVALVGSLAQDCPLGVPIAELVATANPSGTSRTVDYVSSLNAYSQIDRNHAASALSKTISRIIKGPESGKARHGLELAQRQEDKESCGTDAQPTALRVYRRTNHGIGNVGL